MPLGQTKRAGIWVFAVAILLSTGVRAGRMHGQAQVETGTSAIADAALPDSPGALLRASGSASTDSTAADTSDAPVVPTRNLESTAIMVPARKYHRVVRPYEEAGPLSGFDKIELSLANRATVGEALGTTISAGWSQWRDSRPHYGTDADAFEKRLGALALKQTSQSIFAYGIYAAAFHDDPRYYVMGPTMKPVQRAIYSAERTIMTQKDDGAAAINWAKIAGIATSTALTTAYYPAVDHGFGNESKAFATSLAGSILNDELHEFSGDVFRLIHRSR